MEKCEKKKGSAMKIKERKGEDTDKNGTHEGAGAGDTGTGDTGAGLGPAKEVWEGRNWRDARENRPSRHLQKGSLEEGAERARQGADVKTA